MFPFAEMGQAMLTNIKFLAINPFIYIVIILFVWQYKKQLDKERAMFSAKINSLGEILAISLGAGLIAGMFASSLLILIGVVLNPADMIYVWVLAVAIALIDLRYLCFSYATGILGVLAFLTMIFPQGESLWLVGKVWTGIASLNIPVIIALVAILHLTEALLIWTTGAKKASPVYISCKRGKLIGGYSMQKFWLVPLFVIVAIDPSMLGTGIEGDIAESATASTIYFPNWWPLLPLSHVAGMIMGMLPIPAVLAYGDLAISRTPEHKAQKTALFLGLYSLVLLGLALLAPYSPWLLLLAALFSALAHEAIIVHSRREEFLDTPLYANPDEGVKILYVMKGSLAADIGLLAGETILRVNSVPVNDRLDLHTALSSNTYLRMEVLNKNDDIKFVNTPLFKGEHHSIGLILVPDGRTRRYLQLGEEGFLQRIFKKFF